jgi:hypothetical protein
MPARSRTLAAVPPEKPAPALAMGDHTVDLECPDCRAILRTSMTLQTSRSHKTDDAPRLKLNMTNNKALDHICGGGADGKGTPAMFDDNGQAAEPADADPFGGDPFGGNK